MQHTEQLEYERVAFQTVENPFLACFSGPKPYIFQLFPLESEPTGKLPFPVRSPPVFYPLRRYENKWNFHQLMSTKSKMHSRRFCSQKKKTACIISRLRQIGWSVWRAISFLPSVLTLLYYAYI